MYSKVLFSFLTILLCAQLIAADPEYCPNPTDANELVFTQNILEAAPSIGRTQGDVIIPATESSYSCVSVVGSPATAISVSIIAFGFSDQGVHVRVVSDGGVGIDHDVLAYTA